MRTISQMALRISGAEKQHPFTIWTFGIGQIVAVRGVPSFNEQHRLDRDIPHSRQYNDSFGAV